MNRLLSTVSVLVGLILVLDHSSAGDISFGEVKAIKF